MADDKGTALATESIPSPEKSEQFPGDVHWYDLPDDDADPEEAELQGPANRAEEGPDVTASGDEDAPVSAGEALPVASDTRLRRVIRKVTSLLGRSAAVALLLAIWETLPRLGVVDRVFLPPLSEVVGAWYELALKGELGEHVGASLGRSLAGFALAIVTVIPLGLLIGWYKPVADFLTPLLELFRNTSAVALLPVFTLILGLGETAKITFVLYACAWPILLNTISGVKTVDALLIKSARSMSLGPLRLFQKVILPAAVPTIFTGVRLAGAYSILVLLFAEMVGAKAGLGYLINAAQFNFRIPDMYAGIITISLLGLLFNQLLVTLERRFSTWRTT